MCDKIKTYAKRCVESVKNGFTKVECDLAVKGHDLLDGTAAEAYVDTGVKILIAVVIGALLLTVLIALFKNIVSPSVENSVQDMFDIGNDYIANAEAGGGI